MPSRAAMMERRFGPALLAIVLLAAVQAVLAGAHRELDVDEPFMAAALARPDQLTATFAHDNVPLGYLLLLAWTRAFGSSPFAFRSLSIAAFSAAALLVGLAARRSVSPAAGLLAALCVACSAPLGLDHATSARPYALLLFFSAAALRATIHADEARRVSRGAMLLTAIHVLGLFTHPVFVFVSVASAVAGAITGRRRLLLALAPSAAIAIYTVSWWPILRQTMTLPTTSWMAAPGVDDLVAAYTQMWGNRNAFVFAGIVIALLAVRGVAGWRALSRHTATALLIALVVVAELYLVSQVKPVYIAMRTPVVLLPAVSFLLASVVVPLGTPLLAGLMALLLVSASARQTYTRWRTPDPAPTRASLAVVATRVACGDTIVATGLSYTPVTYYAASAGVPDCVRILAFPPSVASHPGWLDFSAGHADRTGADALETAARIPETGKTWVFLTSRGITSAEGHAFVAALQASWRLEETLDLRGALFDEVQVYVPRR